MGGPFVDLALSYLLVVFLFWGDVFFEKLTLELDGLQNALDANKGVANPGLLLLDLEGVFLFVVGDESSNRADYHLKIDLRNKLQKVVRRAHHIHLIVNLERKKLKVVTVHGCTVYFILFLLGLVFL